MAITAPLLVVAFLAGSLPLFRAEKSLPEIALDLGDPEPEIRQKAFTQLLQRKDAVPILLKVLDLPAHKNELLEWNGDKAHLLAIEGLGRLQGEGSGAEVDGKVATNKIAGDAGENFLGSGRNW